MENKKNYIDGVDVSGCNNIDEWEHCNICQVLIKTIPNRNQCLTEGDLRCEFYPNCYYKQLQRLKAENEELKKQIRNNETAYHTELGTYNMECGNLLEENKNLIEENERLKEENEHLTEKEEEAKHYLQEADKFQQCLQEIREMATLFHSVNENKGLDRFKNNILSKINEVIGAE